MLGGVFSHFGLPDGKTRKGTLHRQDRRHLEPDHAGDSRTSRIKDELYYQLQMMPDVQPLATVEYQGTAWPVAWTRTFGKGRVFHTTMGHRGFGTGRGGPAPRPQPVASGRPGHRMGRRRDGGRRRTDYPIERRFDRAPSPGGFDNAGLITRVTRPTRSSRRAFLGATGGCALSFTIVPRHVLGGTGFVAPRERINVASIGVGGMGGGDIATVSRLGANIVALCDVDEERAAGIVQRVPQGTTIQGLPQDARRGSAAGSTRSRSARPTTSTPWRRWRRSVRVSMSTARSR